VEKAELGSLAQTTVVMPGQVGLDQVTVLASGDGFEAGGGPTFERGQVLVA